MPKRSKFPGLRAHSWKTAGGERRTAYYLERTEDGKRTETPLGTDYAEAIRKWDALVNHAPRIAGTLEEAFAAWEVAVLPTYRESTRADYSKSLRLMRPVFGPARWGEVTFPVLKQYLRKRSGKTRANRELSVLSLIWNWARGEGMTELHWPAAGLGKARWKNKESAREFAVTDDYRKTLSLCTASATRL